jgi:ankyrin repeat protein
MHAIAIGYSSKWDEIKNKSNDEAILHNRDWVLQWTPLQYAIQLGHCYIVERLLESNADRSGLDMIRQSAQDPDYINRIIIRAAEEGAVLLLDFLYSIGVNIHQASDEDNPSPLHAAMFQERLNVVKWLIQHGADCNTRYSDGQTPLFYAVTYSSVDVVRALMEEGGASLDIRDDKGRTVIDCAEERQSDEEEEREEIVNYLQERMV